MNDLYLLAINLTKRCNLACQHCYMDAEQRGNRDANELSTDEVTELLSQVAKRSQETMVVLTGGEPLLRPDLEKIAMHGARLGLAMVVGTNGTLLTEARVAALKAAGVLGLGISIDSLNRDYHDRFRGLDGCWQKTLAGIDACRQQQLDFQIHFTVTETNLDELPAVIDFCNAKGARVLNVFFLVCTGRAETAMDISHEYYEETLKYLITAQAENPQLIIRPRCAPHYKRVAYEHNPAAKLSRISGNEGDGCIAGIHYCRITPTGEVTPCPYIEESVGSLRQHSFAEIWETAPTLQALRYPALQGKCGSCEYQKLCGGCRARPVAEGKTIMDEDRWCHYQPSGGTVIEPLLADSEHPTVTWSVEAAQRLQRAPGFIRKMIRKKAEAYVTDQQQALVTCEHLNQLTAMRFGGSSPKRPAWIKPHDSTNNSLTNNNLSNNNLITQDQASDHV